MPAGLISALFLIGCFLYLVHFRPMLDQKRKNLNFDNRVLGFVDGLYFAGKQAGVRFYCTNFELLSYVNKQLSASHRLPGNQCLIKYTTAQERTYYSHTCPNDYALFAILCIARYAKENGNSPLADWCESMMNSASQNAFRF